MDTSSQGITVMPLKPEVRAHIIVESVMQFLVFVVVGLRFYSRQFLGAGIGIDDLIILLSTLLSAVVFGLMVAIQVAGTGYEQTEAAANIPTILLLTFVTVPTYLTALLACKLSMLAFYLRVFQKQSLRIYVFVTMGLCVLWFVAHFLANVFICSPVEAQWKIELIMSGQGTCGDQIPIFQSMIITNMLTDLIIMILPIKTIMSLQMRLPEKLGLLASFMLLGAVFVVGSVRVNFVSTVDMRANLTKSMPLSLLTTTLEPNFAILCVSIPMLRPIYTKYRARYGSSRGATKLSDNAPATIGGSGAPRSGKQNSRPGKGGNDIAMYTFSDGRDKQAYHSNIEAGSAQSLESGESEQKLTTSVTVQRNR